MEDEWCKQIELDAWVSLNTELSLDSLSHPLTQCISVSMAARYESAEMEEGGG